MAHKQVIQTYVFIINLRTEIIGCGHRRCEFFFGEKISKRSWLALFSLISHYTHAWKKFRTKRDNKNNYVLRSCIIIYENHRERERFVIFIYKNFLIIEPSAWHLGKIVRAPPLLYYKSRAYPCVAPTDGPTEPWPSSRLHAYMCYVFFWATSTQRASHVFFPFSLSLTPSLTAIVLSAHRALEEKNEMLEMMSAGQTGRTQRKKVICTERVK